MIIHYCPFFLFQSVCRLITSEMVGIPEINPDLPIPSSSGLMSQESLHKRPSATIPPPPHPSLRHRNMPQQLLRPSVITCAPAPLLREPNRTDGGPIAMVPGAGAGLGPVPPPYLNGRASSAERWSAKNHLPLQPQNAGEKRACLCVCVCGLQLFDVKWCLRAANTCSSLKEKILSFI